MCRCAAHHSRWCWPPAAGRGSGLPLAPERPRSHELGQGGGSGLWAWALGSLPVAPAAPGLPVGLAASTARRARGQLWSSRASSSSFEPLLYRQREAETDTALCFLPALSITPTEQATHLKVINASRVLTTRLKWTAGCRITGVKKQNSLKFHNSPESSQMCLLLT